MSKLSFTEKSNRLSNVSILVNFDHFLSYEFHLVDVVNPNSGLSRKVKVFSSPQSTERKQSKNVSFGLPILQRRDIFCFYPFFPVLIWHSF